MVYFLVEWAKDKRRTWSGTCYGLYVALSKRIKMIDVDINIKESLIVRFFNKVQRKIRRNDFGIRRRKTQYEHVRDIISDSKAMIFQFAEVVFDRPQMRTFIYQDLSVSYVKYMCENLPETFKYSTYQIYSKSSIDSRAEIQDEYYKTCGGIFTMGKWLADDLTNRCGLPADKVHHVGGGINLNKELIDYSKKEGNKLLFVGRDFVRKGGEMVYRAFCRLKESYPEVELYVVGPSANPFPNNTVSGYKWGGEIVGPQLADYFNKCDVFVMPSYFEAYGLVFLEALSFGLPCIGRNVYEMPYLIEEGVTGHLLKEDDVDSLADMMKDLLSNKSIKQNVVDKRDWYLREFSWDAVAERICKFI